MFKFDWAQADAAFSSRLAATARRHWQALIFSVLLLCTLIAYSPVLRLGFTTDDYIEIGARHFDALDSLAHDDLYAWATRFAQRSFIDPVTDWPIFRPARQWLLWSDYLMWHLSPLGYHLASLSLHLLTSFLVALIAWRLTRQRLTAFLAGLLFALLYSHTMPVVNISSLGHVMAGLFVALSFLCYLLPRKPLTTGLALLGFGLALGSKETAVVLPVLLLAYEAMTVKLNAASIRDSIKRQLPFWLTLAAYFLARLAVLGQLVASPYPLGTWLWQDQLAGYLQRMFAPFLNDLTTYEILPALAVYVLLLLIYRARPTARLGLLWVPLALLPTLTFRPTDRYFYTPSIGFALALACILANPIPALSRGSRALGWALVLAWVAFSSSGYALIEAYIAGNQVVSRFVERVQTIHPSFPPNAKIYVTGLPGGARQGLVFNNPRQPQYALQLAYGNPSLRVLPADYFPLAAQDLQNVFFLEYDDGEVSDRGDLVQALRSRQSCPSTPDSTLTWDFQNDPEGWQAWNEIDQWQVRDGVLSFTTTGKNPYLGSPFLSVPPSRLGPIEIRVAAQSSRPTVNAKLYWQLANMDDFSPDLRKGFSVKADNSWHTYRIQVSDASGKDINAPLVRLRLDPADTGARMRIDWLRIQCK